MRCRALVLDPTTNKQQIVWFGSYGKNTNYIPVVFNNDDLDINGVPKNWASIYKNYYYITTDDGAPFLNTSPVFGEHPIFPNTNLYPGNDLYPNTGAAIGYFRKVGNAYVPVTEQPDDWADNYMNYYMATFVQNAEPIYDPTIQYYIHNNKLEAENYSEKQHGVRDSLIQRLSVIKGELWYKASYGLPLMEKIRNKGIYDSIIINIITTHPDIVNLSYFYSEIVKSYVTSSGEILKNAYVLEFTAYTAYNEEITVRYTI